MTIITTNFKQAITNNLLSICGQKETDRAGLLVVAHISNLLSLLSCASANFPAAALQINNYTDTHVRKLPVPQIGLTQLTLQLHSSTQSEEGRHLYVIGVQRLLK